MAAIAAGLLGLAATPAQAAIQGPCQAAGYSTSRPGTAQEVIARAARSDASVTSADLGAVDLWRVRQADTLVVLARADRTQHRESAAVSLFGLPVTILHGQQVGNNVFTGPWHMTSISGWVSRIGVTAGSDACSGSVVLESDRNPLLTATGAGGLLLLLLGLALALVMGIRHAFRPTRGGIATWASGHGGGLVAGIGAGLWLQQAGPLSPLDKTTLIVPLVGLLVGAGIAFVSGRVPSTKPLRARLEGIPKRMRVPGAAGLAVVVTALALGIGYLPVGRQLNDQVLTKAQAASIATQAWNSAKQARTKQQGAVAAPWFTGQAAGYVAGLLRTADGPSEANMLTRNLRVTSALIPHRSGYPADFVVSGNVDISKGQSAREMSVLMLFIKNGANEHWRCATVDANYSDKGAFPIPAADRDGYAKVPTDNDAFVMTSDQAAKKFADYLSGGVAAGAGPAASPFVKGPNTTDIITTIVQMTQARKQQNITQTTTFQGATALRTYQLASGSALVFATFDMTEKLTPAQAGGTLAVGNQSGLHEIDLSGPGMALLAVPAKNTGHNEIQVSALDLRLTRTNAA
jgi:hypothetical protein